MDMAPVLRQDFKAFTLSIEEGQIDLTVVFANRFLSNVVFGADKRYTTLGYILRDLAVDTLKASQVGGEAQKILKAGREKVLEAIAPLVEGANLDLVAAWKSYHGYVSKTRLALASKAEADAYTEMPEVAGEALKYLLDEFLLNERELAEPATVVPHGCFNEVSRLVTSHGVSEVDLPLIAILECLQWLYEYLPRHWESTVNNLSAEGHKAYVAKVKTRFLAFLNPMRPLLDRSQFPNLEAVAAPASDILANILIEWRKEFIRYMEIGGVTERKKPVAISKETREKLSESIKGAIEKDVLGKKAKK